MKFSKSKKKKRPIKSLIITNDQFKRSDINILLNRVKSNEKLEFRKKIYSIIATILGVLGFGAIFFY